MSDTAEAKARRLAELTEQIEAASRASSEMSAERIALMVSLHRDDGWNNVQIGQAAGLTRARVSTILKPILEQLPEVATVNGG